MNRAAKVNARLPQARLPSIGAGAPQNVTFATVATANTANGRPRATAHHTQPTRQRIIRAPNAR